MYDASYTCQGFQLLIDLAKGAAIRCEYKPKANNTAKGHYEPLSKKTCESFKNNLPFHVESCQMCSFIMFIVYMYVVQINLTTADLTRAIQHQDGGRLLLF